MTKTLNWNKKNIIPDHNCYVLVLVEWNNFTQRLAVFEMWAHQGCAVQFGSYPTIAWAEIDMEGIEREVNSTFDCDFVNFLHNNIKNL